MSKQENDKELEKLITENYNDIIRYCCAKLKDPDKAKDCTIEVFEIFFEKYSDRKIMLTDNINHWFLSTAKKVVTRFIRRSNSKTKVSFEEIISTSCNDIYNCERPFKDIISEEEYRIICDRHLKGMTIKEMADQMEINEKTLYKRIERISNKILKYRGGVS